MRFDVRRQRANNAVQPNTTTTSSVRCGCGGSSEVPQQGKSSLSASHSISRGARKLPVTLASQGQAVVDEPWCDAKVVGPPLIRYFQERTFAGESFSEWLLTLRALNKSWYSEATSYVTKVTASGDAVEQLSKSLLGSLAHITDLTVGEIGVVTFAPIFDEEEGMLLSGSECMNADRTVNDVLNSAINVRTLSLDFVVENTARGGALIPLTALKTLRLNGARSLAIVEKCPNLENLILNNCCLVNTRLRCGPRLRRLAIDAPDIRISRISHQRILCTRWKTFDQSLLDVLVQSTQLTELKLACSPADSHAHIQAVCNTLKGLVNLKTLSLVVNFKSQIDLGDEIGGAFMDALPPSLRELELWGLFSWADCHMLMHASGLASLEKLALGNGRGTASYPTLEWVTKMPTVAELSFWGDAVVGRAFAWLRRLPLTRVVLNVQSVEPEAFHQLCWVGDNLKQIEVWCYDSELDNNPLIAASKRILEQRGVQVNVVCMS